MLAEFKGFGPTVLTESPGSTTVHSWRLDILRSKVDKLTDVLVVFQNN
jgi:hypothetical protein